MSDQLLEILARLLKLQHEHNCLLCPVTRLEKVVSLEQRLVLAVREVLEHGSGVEVPDIRPLHDVQAERTENTKVDRRVDLLHEPSRLALTANTTVNGEWANQLLHDELAREREHDSIECHEGNILLTLSVHDRTSRDLGWLRVGKENRAVHWIGRGRINGVERKQEDQNDQRQQPSVFEAGVGETMEQRAIATTLCMGLGCGLLGVIFELLDAPELHVNVLSSIL